MGFMGLGPAELFIILVIAVVVFGPGKLPELGNSLGKSIKEFRKATSEFTEPLNEVKQSVKEVTEPLNEVKQSVNEIKQLPTTLLTGSPTNASSRTGSGETARSETAESAQVEAAVPDLAEAATPAHADGAKLCADCSTQNPSSSEFCSKCGKSLA